MYFLRRAHELLEQQIPKELSPSFWDAENIIPTESGTFDNIQYGVEHPLGTSSLALSCLAHLNMAMTGRLLYTTGEVAVAVQYFLGLLCHSPSVPATGEGQESQENPQKLILEDFRTAFSVSPMHSSLFQ